MTLPLYPGASPCVGSGYCCKVRPCPFGKGTPCVHLKPVDGLRYTCGIAEEIMTKPGWELSPAFGAGCSSTLFNADRARIIRLARATGTDTLSTTIEGIIQ